MDLFEHLPRALTDPGPRGLPWWQWLALPVLAAIIGLVSLLLGRLTQVGLHLITRRTSVSWDDQFIDELRNPLACLWFVVLAFAVTGEMGLPARAEAFVYKVLRTGALVTFFWMLIRMVGIVGRSAETSAWARSRPSMRALVPLGVRLGYFAVVAIALVAVLADLGYPVASLVAGLGIGGLAVALAGQKTVENLFGAFSISVDQPFSVGDFITVDGTQGEVQAIGLRSTRIRTQDRTVVTIPNGKLAEMKVETFALRDRIRLGMVLGLVRSSSSAQVRAVIEAVAGVLRAHPKTYQDDLAVRLKAISNDALEIEVNAYFLTTDYNEYAAIRQDMLLAFLSAVEQAGTALSLPTRTVVLEDRRARAGGA
jgi:MscS family membrane protein